MFDNLYYLKYHEILDCKNQQYKRVPDKWKWWIDMVFDHFLNIFVECEDKEPNFHTIENKQD